NQWNLTLKHKPPGEVIDLLLIPNLGKVSKDNGQSQLILIRNVFSNKVFCVLSRKNYLCVSLKKVPMFKIGSDG
uniref:hypothetical protein n=1 Tax=Prevotella heparinolytica TaxID=28113 RepID=UPI0035A12E4F